VFQLNFTATGFAAGAPQDPVSGSLVFEAASATSTVTALDSINLTIAGHTYALSDVFLDPAYAGTTETLVGGSLNGEALNIGTNDFSLGWFPSSGAGHEFDYATAGTRTIFYSPTFSTFEITSVTGTVPEPASVSLLLAIGPFLLLGLRRLRRTARSE
jgi:hypothetical protein